MSLDGRSDALTVVRRLKADPENIRRSPLPVSARGLRLGRFAPRRNPLWTLSSNENFGADFVISLIEAATSWQSRATTVCD